MPSRTTTDDDDSEGEDEAAQVSSNDVVDDAVMIRSWLGCVVLCWVGLGWVVLIRRKGGLFIFFMTDCDAG